jgi:hypothetical protein
MRKYSILKIKETPEVSRCIILHKRRANKLALNFHKRFTHVLLKFLLRPWNLSDAKYRILHPLSWTFFTDPNGAPLLNAAAGLTCVPQTPKNSPKSIPGFDIAHAFILASFVAWCTLDASWNYGTSTSTMQAYICYVTYRLKSLLILANL